MRRGGRTSGLLGLLLLFFPSSPSKIPLSALSALSAVVWAQRQAQGVPTVPCGSAGRAASSSTRAASATRSGSCRNRSGGARNACCLMAPDGGGTQSRAEHGATAGDDCKEHQLHPANAADDDGCTDEVAGVGGDAGADDDRKGPRSAPPARVADDVGCAGEAAKVEADNDEICGICLDVCDNPVQLSCGHSFCEVCLDGWHMKYDVHQPRNCPMCRHRAKPSKEIISKLLVISAVISSPSAEHGAIRTAKRVQEELLGALLKKGHTNEEITDAMEEYSTSYFVMPCAIVDAVRVDDAQTILDWLGSPVEESKVDSRNTDFTMMHMTAIYGNKQLASLLLQLGAAVDDYDFNGGTPILHALIKSRGFVNEIVTLLYEWGASLEHHIPGENGANADAWLATTPMFQNELVKRRCEIIDLNQHKDLIGQTCIVEKYIAKKDRYKVTTEHAHETFLVGRDNLKWRDRTPDDPGYYVTFEGGEYKRHTFASNEECQEFVRCLRAGQECSTKTEV